MTRPSVLVLGAAGRFGAAAVRAFATAGWQVLAQQRRAPAARLPLGAEWVDTPLNQTHALAIRAAGATLVVYAVNPLYTRWNAELMPLFHQGLAVAERLRATFLLPGNVYNFGAGMPALLTPQTAEQPTTPKGRQRVAMEQELAHRAGRGLTSVVVRAGDFFGGDGSGSWFDQAIVARITQGRLVYPGPLDVPHAWAYLPDFARACAALASRPLPPGLTRVHFAGHTLTGSQLLGAIERAAALIGVGAGRGFTVGSLPWPLLRLAGLVHPMSREIARMSYLWRVPHALDGRDLETLTGPLAATPIDAAVRAALLALPAFQPDPQAAMPAR